MIQRMVVKNGSEENGLSERNSNLTSWGGDQDTKVLGVVWLVGKYHKYRVLFCQDRFVCLTLKCLYLKLCTFASYVLLNGNLEMKRKVAAFFSNIDIQGV